MEPGTGRATTTDGREADARPGDPRALRLSCALLLAGLAAATTFQHARGNDGIDFYNFWGVAEVARENPALSSPYRYGADFLAALKERAATTGDTRLASAGEFWTNPDYTATPTLYAAAAVFPRDYTVSLLGFQLLQLAAFLGGCLLLGRRYGVDVFTTTALACIALLGYQPLVTDLRVANLGSIQFGVLAAAVIAAGSLDRFSPARRRAASAGVAAALAALTLAKPNVVLVTGLLFVHLLMRLGGRDRTVAAVVGAVTALSLWALPMIYFGSARVWEDWYRYVYGADAHMLVRSLPEGNYAPALLLSRLAHVDVFAASIVLGAAVTLSLLAIVVYSERRMGDVVRQLRMAVAASPELAVTIGLCLTVATAPLFWIHYYVLMLIPALWFASGSASETRAPALLGAAAVLLSSGIVGLLFTAALPADAGMALSITLSWIPLWAATLMLLWRGTARAREKLAT